MPAQAGSVCEQFNLKGEQDMASNKLPRKREQLFTAAQGLADGLKAQEARLGIKQNTEQEIRTVLAAALSANTAFNTLSAANAVLIAAQNVAAGKARDFIFAAKGVLANSLGRQWSPAWLPTGFTGNSLRIPTHVAERQALLESLQKYFAENPDKEVETLNVTASQAGALLDALKNVRAAVAAGNSAVTAAGKQLKQKERELRWRYSALIGELQLLLDGDDPTWYAFGLKRPSDPETPAIPDNVSVTAGLPGTIVVSWAAAQRADRYRIYKKEDGDGEFQPAQTTVDQEALITGLKGGSPVEIRVSAINNAGESLPSIPAQIVVPAENPPAAQD
jgi:hypothetical protein